MRKMFCVDKENFDITDVITHLDKKLGLKLGHNPSNIVHGFVAANHYPQGSKESPARNKGKYWHNEEPTDNEHSCVVIHLYEREEAPNVHHVTHLKPHPKLNEMHHHIEGHLNDLGKQNKHVFKHKIVDEGLNKHLDFFLPRG